MASNTPPMAPPPAQPATPAPAPKKGSKTLLWILAGCGGLIVIVGIIFAVLTYWGVHKFKGYAESAKKNPAVAAAKLAVAFNPELEIVAEDDEKGTLTIRNKKTGEEITMNAEDIKQGRLKFKNEKGEEVTFEGSGEEGKEGFRVKTDKGTMTFGHAEGEAPPPWVPTYPGAKVMASSREKTDEGLKGTYSFQTADSTADVVKRYESELKRAGFEVERTDMGAISNLSAKGDGGKRKVNLTAIPLDKLTQVTIAYEVAGQEGG